MSDTRVQTVVAGGEPWVEVCGEVTLLSPDEARRLALTLMREADTAERAVLRTKVFDLEVPISDQMLAEVCAEERDAVRCAQGLCADQQR